MDTEAAIEMANSFGVKHLVVSGIDSKLAPDRDGWIACGKALDRAGAKLREAGIGLSYHNHAHEFQKLGGEYMFDILMNAAEPINLAAEIDTFWVCYAKVNLPKLIEQYADRCPLLHVKDMLDKKSCSFAEIGRGIIEWSTVLPLAQKCGTKWFIVEQDVCSRDPMESVKMSAEFLAEQ